MKKYLVFLRDGREFYAWGDRISTMANAIEDEFGSDVVDMRFCCNVDVVLRGLDVDNDITASLGEE